MNRIRTAPALVGLMIVPATLLLGAWTPALADDAPTDPAATATPTPGPTDEPTTDPTDEPTDEPSTDPTDEPITDPTPVDCSQYGPDAYPSDDGSCAILGPPPVVVDDSDLDYVPPTHDDPVKRPADTDTSTEPENQTTTDPTTEQNTDPAPETDTLPISFTDSIEPLSARSGDAPTIAGHDGHGTVAAAGIGAGLVIAGGLVIRRKARKA